jgi:flagellar basal-body rod protein FlgF
VLSIASDGSISAAPAGGGKSVTPVARLKLVNPPTTDLARGTDGLFRMKDGSEPPPDVKVRVNSGSIESSNVNAVETMVGMITLARQFEMQMKLMQSADAAARKGTQLLGANA